MCKVQQPTMREGFEALALPLMDKLYGKALSLTRVKLDVADLVQSTYLRAWQYINTFKPTTSFEAWIFRIMMNTFINQYRFQKRWPLSRDFEAIANSISSEEQSASSQIEEGFLAESLLSYAAANGYIK